ncbi:Death-inducer obliterator 1 [Myotis brandtii]|uniref:Death-inducer obliterator 1 n=2 Tax=Myotis brandtii TaxID=109478 RepID=S7NSK0_MYOBR|nr:Death-inducer obliterator 1 [Myotis brandtii]
MKPVPRPLLELPSHPPQHRKDRWDETGSAPNLPSGAPGPAPEAEAQWAPSKGPEYRNQPRPKEKLLDEPEGQPESRQGRAFEDRRREHEHGKPWERERSRNWSRERERDWDRGREWDRHREKDSGRERNANRDREREWDRSRERSRNRDRDRDRDRDRRRDRDRSRSRDRDRDKGREHERGGDRKDRSKSKESTRDPKAEALAPRATDPAAHT